MLFWSRWRAGLPMIVSNVGGNAEAVIDRQNGIVIPPSNVEAFHARAR